MFYILYIFLITPLFIILFNNILTYPWYIDNLLNVPNIIILYTVILLLIFLKTKKIVGIILSVICLYIYTIYFYTGTKETECPEQKFNFFQYNINFNNTHQKEISNYILAHPDLSFVLLQEVSTNASIDFFKSLSENYPYNVGEKPIEGRPNQQILLSKYPINNVNILSFFNYKYKIIDAEIEIADHKITIFALHPSSPRSKILWEERNAVLGELVYYIKKNNKKDFIIVGDLNISVNSNQFLKIFKDLNIDNNKTKFNTWNYDKYPVIDYFITSKIDQLMTSKSIKSCKKEKVVELFHSDHKAIISTLYFD